MSLEGARVVMPDGGSLPDRFVLVIGEEELQRDVEVRSRSATGLGVRFSRPLREREVGADFLRHSSAEARETTAAQSRAQLLERARAGVERMTLGEEAPALEMPEVIEWTVVEGNLDDGEPVHDAEPNDEADEEPLETESYVAAPDDAEAAPADHAETVEMPVHLVEAAMRSDPAAETIVEPGSEPEADVWDDGMGEGDLAVVSPRVLPRTVRRHLPWGAR